VPEPRPRGAQRLAARSSALVGERKISTQFPSGSLTHVIQPSVVSGVIDVGSAPVRRRVA
jgi:hypothetical protein